MSAHDHVLVLVDAEGTPREVWGPYTARAAEGCAPLLESLRPGMRALPLPMQSRNVPLRAAAHG